MGLSNQATIRLFLIRGGGGRRPRRAGACLVAIAILVESAATLQLASPAAAQETAIPAESTADPDSSASTAGDQPSESLRLPEQTVVGEREALRFLPDVKGVDVYDGKKTSVIDPGEPPKIVNDNYRQALSRTPGLVLAEESTPLLSIGYRGLDPHRTQFTQVLKDGIPIAADMFGYPENYYMPPLDAVEQIDFVHGGASLLYGPQPGGALNFVMKKPNPDARFSLFSNQTFGSDSYYSTFNALSGTIDSLGYYGYYYQKQGDGFRQGNSDFALYSGTAKGTYALTDTSSLSLAFDGYNEEHGEPGGLRRSAAPNAVLYQQDRDATSRFFDRFELERYAGSVIFENEITPDTLLKISSWGGYYSRWSARQRGGGFGTLPSGSAARTNSIESQVFKTAGLDARVRQNWDAWGETHSLTAGIQYYHDTSPRKDERGATPDATNGVIRSESLRQTNYGSAFAENRFVFGDFALIPSIRLENFATSIDEETNVEKSAAGVPLADESSYDFEPLVGLGAAYTIAPTIEVYANVSKAYRPEIFSQAVSTSPTTVVAGNLAPGKSWQYELGFRGQPKSFVFWDTSLFWLEFDDQIGSVQLANGLSEIRNVGRSRHLGWEFATQVGMLGLFDWWRDAQLVSTVGEFSVFANVMLLDAEFRAGPFEGKEPAYAPDSLIRAGVEYAWRDRFRAQLLTTVVAQSYGNDNNTADFVIPSYTVWDLTMEADVYKDIVGAYFTVNNLFDADYWARVRSDGIDPAYGRSFYGGIKVKF
jgi:Fe(3+) dicitrate transport protein